MRRSLLAGCVGLACSVGMSTTGAQTPSRAIMDTGCASLGDAAGFVAFSDRDFSSATRGGATITGRIGAARTVTLDGVVVGPASGDSAPTVIAGGDFRAGRATRAGGTVNGGVRYGGSYRVGRNFTVNGGAVHLPPPFSFAANFAALRELSRGWGSIAQSSGATVRLNPASGALELTGRDRGLNVFDVSAAELAAAAGVVIDLTRAGASALINVTTAAALRLAPMYMSLSGSAASTNVAWNLPFAPRLNVTRGVAWKGLILAPSAALRGSNHPQLDGALIADTIPSSDWVLRHVAFTGCLPPVQASPDLSSNASRSVRLGTLRAAIADAAVLTGGAMPTGTMTFSLYGPNDPDCARSPVYLASSTVDGNGIYVSHQFDPKAAGSYRWRVEYPGDDNNNGAGPTGCGDRREGVRVLKARPGLSSSVADAVLPAARAIYDTARLAGAVSPSGTLTFRLYGPGDARCSGRPLFTSTVPVSGGGPHNSDPFSPVRVGEYRWRVRYSGDGNNRPVGETACGAAREEVLVTRARPSLSTVASGVVVLGGRIFDRATLSGGASPRGGLVFRVYGPSDRLCRGRPAASSRVAVSSGNDTYRSAVYTPAVVGVYRWRVSYSGDLNNRRVATGCGGPGETIVVARAPLATPDLTSRASAGAPAGRAVHDTATLAGGANPTGTITFQLYGPADGRCGAPPVGSSTVPVSGDGDYDSGPVVPRAAGRYRWVVTYSGDEHNESAGPTACGDRRERVRVLKARPGLSSSVADAVLPAARAIYDTARLAGAVSPTGTLIFRLFGPGDVRCSGRPVFTSTVPVSGDGPHNSDPFSPVRVGEYRWRVRYSGDANNRPVGETACDAAGEGVLVARARPSLSTVASGVVVLGGRIFDRATLSGGASPRGELVFRVYGPSDRLCRGRPAASSRVAVSSGNDTYRSAVYTPAVVGVYRWRVSYSGDLNNRAVVTGCGGPGETVVVARAPLATPDLTSRASAGGPAGSGVHDTATLAGGADPTGTITFQLYGPADGRCGAPPVGSSTVAVSGDGDYDSGAVVPRAAGRYRWVVTYSGDEHNESAGPTACGEGSEMVAVTRAQPAVKTQSSPSVALGAEVQDIAHLAGGPSPRGAITFRLYGPGDDACSASPAFSASQLIIGNGAYPSPMFRPDAAGTYRWTAGYSGDRNNLPAGTRCGDAGETVVVGRSGPALSTVASGAVVLGGGIFDRATLSGGASPSGGLVFRVYGPRDRFCSGRPVASSRVAVSSGNDTYRSAVYTPAVVGVYRWRVSYSGDLNNRAVVTGCGGPGEAVVVTRAPLAKPDLTSRASAGAPAGRAVHDTATLAGGADPTGTITFELYGPADGSCHAPPVGSSTVPVSGDGDYDSGGVVPRAAGRYRWVVTYSGDEHNESAGPTACGEGSEMVTMARAQPAIGTQSSPSVALGAEVQDIAHLARGPSPRGAITFRLYGPGDDACSASPAFSASQLIIGNGAYPSPTFRPNATGTYRWTASYSGDRNNLPAATRCGDAGETVVVGRSGPVLTTSARPVSSPKRRVRAAGLTIYDTGTLRDGSQPIGEITFALHGPDDPTCSGPPLFTTATSVTGNGTYNSETFTPTASGAYHWIATYSGDADNLPAGPTACGESTERVEVTLPAEPQLASSASAAVTLGGAIHDTGHLSGGSSPGGTIRFRLYGARDPGCTGPAVFTSTVPVSGNGDYDSGSYVPTRPGNYRWLAGYSGDPRNASAGPTACGEAAEVASVRPPTTTPAVPALSTTAAPAGLGAPATDTAHLTGGRNPAGAITFELFGPDDASCSAPPIFVATSAVAGNGDYTTPAFVVPRQGTYRWVASYSGDLANSGTGPSACGGPGETVAADAIPRPSADPGPHGPPPEPKPRPRPKPPPPPPPPPPSPAPPPVGLG